MTYYLKYRPQIVDELDIADVREHLKKALSTDQIPHAFLFAGPKGTGKTSAARILAKVINCEHRDKKTGEPCLKCDSCIAIAKGEHLDILELDAASHRGIDDIRYLREAVKLSPSSAKYKVYIVDEAHMLTTEASNALLKTLEEPPAHVIFILATTNPEKLIDTIRSRTTIIPFRKATQEELMRSLTRVVAGENLSLDEPSLEIIAQAADGTLRDAHKILEQLVSSEVFSAKAIRVFLQKGYSGGVNLLLKSVEKKDLSKIIMHIENAANSGVAMKDYTLELLNQLHNSLLGKVGVGDDLLTSLTQSDLTLLIKSITNSEKYFTGAYIEQIPLELAFIDWLSEDYEKKVETPVPKPVKPILHKPEIKKTFETKNKKTKNTESTDGKSLPLNSTKDTVTTNGETISDTLWSQILATVKPLNPSIEALLRASKPLGFNGETLTLSVYYRFHKERLEENVHRNILEKAIEEVCGAPVRVSCVLSEPPAEKVFESSATKNDVVLTESKDKDIINVAKDLFGA